MKVPKPSDASKALFRTVVERMEGAEVKAMFGNLGGFVNGNMFCGLFGDDLGVRVDPDNRAALVAAGGGPYGPEDRPMKEYVTVPAAWHDAGSANLEEWLSIAFDYVAQFPAK